MPAYIKTMAPTTLLTSIRFGVLNSKTMTLTFVCFICASFLGCLAQETTETQPTSDAATKFEWDTTSPSITTSFDGQQTENTISPRSNPDYSTIFNSQWGPMLMPMKVPSYGDRLYNRKARIELKDSLDLYPFLRRPDAYYADWNDTVQPEYTTYPMALGYQPFPSPGLFYPQPVSFRDPKSARYPDQIDSVTTSQTFPTESQNISASSPAPAFYRSPFARRPDSIQEDTPYSSYFNYPPFNFFLRNTAGVRDTDNTVPNAPYPMSQAFFPPGGPQMYPQVNVFVRPPYGDSESILPEAVAERRESLPPPLRPISPTATTTNPFSGAPLPLQPIPPPLQPNLLPPPSPFSFGYPPPPPGLQPPFPVAPGLSPRPAPIPSNIPVPPPTNNLLEGPIPEVPPPQPLKPPGVPAEIVPPAVSVPDVVNVDVFDPETTKQDKGSNANIPYKFGYDMNDGRGTDQHREESADEDGVVTGSYGYRDMNGVYRVVDYIADKNGFRAFVKSNEPGVANPGSADVVVLAERPPLRTVAEGLRRSDIDVDVIDDESGPEIEASEKK